MRLFHYHVVGLALIVSITAHKVCSADSASEQDYLNEYPVVLSASRLSQPLSEAPSAMTVIDRDMIKASGFRKIPDLFKLVPGMYVSYVGGSQPIVAYHGTTDQYSRRMQVMIDGRSVYMPPNNTIDWAYLPIVIDDIERIEVIRGPAAASYGANSTQGVINIITKDASGVVGKSVKFTHGNGGINDVSAYFGDRGEMFDYRMTLAYTADNGYDTLTTSPNNYNPDRRLINNQYDNNQALLMNYRGNYHPDLIDSFDIQFGFNHDVLQVGNQAGTPSPANPTGTNGNPIHNLYANTSFMQGVWKRQLENFSEFNLRYYHVQEDQHETFPVYLNGILCPGPMGNGAYCPGPSVQTLTVGRDQLEVNHTIWTSESNRLIYGAAYQRNSVSALSDIPPMPLFDPSFPVVSSSSPVLEDFQIFANDEWRVNPRLLLNIGGMFERDEIGQKNLSPRASLNLHVTPQNTFRIAISVAYRTPALNEINYPAVQPGELTIPSATATAPGLVSEKMVSHEIGYIGQSKTLGTLLDFRLYMEQLSNGINYNSTTNTLENDFSAKYHGFEATLKKTWDKTGFLTINFAHQLASSNGATLAVSSNPYLKSQDPTNNDILSASIPQDSASILYSQRLSGNFSFSASHYYQSSSQSFDRGYIDHQPTSNRTDIRIARQFHDGGRVDGEVALIVQELFNTSYTEYVARDLFNRRVFFTLTLHQL